MLAQYELQHRRDALEQALRTRRTTGQAGDATRRGPRGGPQAVRRRPGQRGRAQGGASASINSRYDALGEIDESRIKSAQAALDDWDRARREAKAAAASTAAH